MQELPGNSHAKKPGPKVEPDAKRVEKIELTGKVSVKKRSFGKRLRENLFPGHAEAVGEYLMWDVLIPSAKDVMADMASTFFERMLFGDARPGRRPMQQRGMGGNTSHVSYNRMSSGQPQQGIRQEPRQPAPQHRAREFDDILFETRVEAERILAGMFDTIGRYQACTIADMYDLVGLTGDYTASDWGWTNLDNVRVERARGAGYFIDLPEPIRM